MMAPTDLVEKPSALAEATSSRESPNHFRNLMEKQEHKLAPSDQTSITMKRMEASGYFNRERTDNQTVKEESDIDPSFLPSNVLVSSFEDFTKLLLASMKETSTCGDTKKLGSDVLAVDLYGGGSHVYIRFQENGFADDDVFEHEDFQLLLHGVGVYKTIELEFKFEKEKEVRLEISAAERSHFTPVVSKIVKDVLLEMDGSLVECVFPSYTNETQAMAVYLEAEVVVPLVTMKSVAKIEFTNLIVTNELCEELSFATCLLKFYKCFFLESSQLFSNIEASLKLMLIDKYIPFELLADGVENGSVASLELGAYCGDSLELRDESEYEQLKSLCIAIDKRGMPIGWDEEADEVFQMGSISASWKGGRTMGTEDVRLAVMKAVNDARAKKDLALIGEGEVVDAANASTINPIPHASASVSSLGRSSQHGSDDVESPPIQDGKPTTPRPAIGSPPTQGPSLLTTGISTSAKKSIFEAESERANDGSGDDAGGDQYEALRTVEQNKLCRKRKIEEILGSRKKARHG